MATTPGQYTTTPGGKELVEEVQPGPDRKGRYWPVGTPTPDWVPVTEEAPSDGKSYARKNATWQPVSVTDVLSVTEIIPAIANVAVPGIVTAHVYGTGFTNSTQIVWDGVPLPPTSFVSANELTLDIDPAQAASPYVATVAVIDGATIGTGAAGFHFVSAEPGLKVTEIIPAIASVGFTGNITARLFGSGFTAATQVLWDGVVYPCNFVSASELTLTVTPSLGVAPSVAVVTVQDGATLGAGAAGFHFVSVTGVDYGIGLSLDSTTTPPIVHLQPAGDSPATLGGTYVVDRVRNNTEGLELGIDGRLRAPLATDSLAGTILEPPPDDKGYVRRRDLAGNSAWVPPSDTLIDFGTGLTKDETTTPPIVHLQPALDYAIGGLMEPPQDGLSYVRQFDQVAQIWKWVETLTAGLQITSIIPDKAIYGPTEPLLTVHAYGAEFTPTTVAVVDGVDAATTIISTTELTFVMNPAVPVNEQFHIITVRDPAAVPPDLAVGLGAEQFDFIKASTAVDYGTGLSFDTTTTPPIVNLQPATDFSIGGIMEPDRGTPPVNKKFVREFNPIWAEGWRWTETQATRIAGNYPETVGVVYVPKNRGLDLDLWTGSLTLLHASDNRLGGIYDASGDPANQGKRYVRSFGQWHEAETTRPAGETLDKIGVVYVPDDRGLDIGPDGMLTLKPASDSEIGGLREPPFGPATWVRSGEMRWIPAPIPTRIAGNEPNEVGIVYVKDDQGISLNADGQIALTPASEDRIGGLREVPSLPADQAYVRKYSEWVPFEDTGGISDVPPYPPIVWGRATGRWMEIPQYGYAGNTVEEAGVIWVKDDQGLSLNPDGQLALTPASEDRIGGLREVPSLPAGKTYVRKYAEWVEAQDAKMMTHTELGVGRVTNRTDRQGLNLDANGYISAPLATHEHAGTFVEPSNIGLQHVRVRTAAGDYQWHEITSVDGIGDVPLDPPIVWGRTHGRWSELPNTRPAGNSVDKMGVVWVEEDQGLSLNPTGQLSLTPASEDRIGGIREVPSLPVGKRYVREYANWVEATAEVDPAGKTVDKIGIVYVPDDHGLQVSPDGALAAVIASDVNFGVIKDASADPADAEKTYSRKFGQWVEAKATNIAGNTPADVGVIYVPEDRGLDLDETTGSLTLLPASDDKIGGLFDAPIFDINDPVEANQTYARQFGRWVKNTANVLVADEPPVDPPPNALWWDSDSGDMFIWYDDGNSKQWVQVTGEDAENIHFGVGLLESIDKTRVDLKYAGQNGEIGGIKVFGRGPTNGLEFDVVTHVLTAPLATEVAAGTITNPPNDGLQYARIGGGWAPVSASTIFTSDDPPPNPTPNTLWYDTDSGNTYLWYTDVDSSQWVQIATSSSASTAITDAPVDGTPYARQDANWVSVTSLNATMGDVKSGFQIADHAGWVLLNGRAVSTLTATQQAEAALLGFTANIPDAALCGLRQDSAAALGAVGGSATISQANLPAVNLTAASAGDHYHNTRLRGGTTTPLVDCVWANNDGMHAFTNGAHHGGTNYEKDRQFSTNAGAHTHTVALGGSGTAYHAKAVIVNFFVYLGV